MDELQDTTSNINADDLTPKDEEISSEALEKENIETIDIKEDESENKPKETENIENAQNPENAENTESLQNIEKNESPENADNTGSPENADNIESLENADDTESPENADNTESPENPDNIESLENAESVENTESPENTLNSENAGNSENSKNVQNAEENNEEDIDAQKNVDENIENSENQTNQENSNLNADSSNHDDENSQHNEDFPNADETAEKPTQDDDNSQTVTELDESTIKEINENKEENNKDEIQNKLIDDTDSREKVEEMDCGETSTIHDFDKSATSKSSCPESLDVLSDDRTQNISATEHSPMDVDTSNTEANQAEKCNETLSSDVTADSIIRLEEENQKSFSENGIEQLDKSNQNPQREEDSQREEDKAISMESNELIDLNDDDEDDVDKDGINERSSAEANVEAEEPGESADICLIPDNDEELTGAEKEQAILARQNAEKEDEEKETSEEQITDQTSNEVTSDDIEAVIEIEPTEELEKIPIFLIVHSDQICIQCGEHKSVEYRYKNIEMNSYVYICEQSCLDPFLEMNNEKFYIRRKKYIVDDLTEEVVDTCILCKEIKPCIYTFKQEDDILFICNEVCYNLLSKEEPDKLRLKRQSIRVKNLTETIQPDLEPKIVERTAREVEMAKLDRDASFIRRCCSCLQTINFSHENLRWQTLDFCNQLCLGRYQNTIGDKCRTCIGSVSHQSLGKYCVRFGFDICQFCCASCLDKYKKSLKNCSYCQKDIVNSAEGFLAPVGDNEQFKDFCSQICMKRYDFLCNPKRKNKTEQCAVCNNKKQIQVELLLDGREHYFCSNPCYSAFRFVNNIVPDQCGMCTKYFERKLIESYTIYTDKASEVFCNQICMNMYITQNRKIVFCQWCKVKKYNFDMIEKHSTTSETITMCSLNCLVLHGVSLNAISKQKVKCDNCLLEKTPQYHLTMSDSSIRNFCTYQCVMQFQSQFSRTPLTLEGTQPPQQHAPFPTGLPKRVKTNQSQVQTVQVPLRSQSQEPQLPIIASVDSLAGEVRRPNRRIRKKNFEDDNIPSPPPTLSMNLNRQQQGRVYTTQIMQPTMVSQKSVQKKSTGTMTSEGGIKTAIIAVPPMPPKISNKIVMCKPMTSTKGVTCKPLSFNTGCQTDEDLSAKILIPVPVPIYVPQPMYMYSAPFPVPVPIPLPIPVPIFIPTTRNSANGIMKEIKKIQDKMPADPFEAELLMMAEMVAGDKKKEESDSDDDDEVGGDIYTNNEEIVDTNNSYGEDVLQMALKMATEYDEPAVDLESAMTANTITQPPPGQEEDDSNLLYHQMQMHERPARGRKRMATNQSSGRNNRMSVAGTPANKRQRRNDVSVIHQSDMSVTPTAAPPSQIITEKPDANMCLKYTFGVNAWKQWVMTKNSDLEKSSIRRKPFKSELLQMTADELNYSLCLFVKEVRKPNGTEYAPDTIYYLVLGIQQYLYENGRIDNIFTDTYYERFTDCLDDVARKFSVLYNDSQYIVTRVEEEHLWECKQLGAHSPHVLLSTLMFFNTKHFNLTTVEEHMQLSFSHIMKHWKRNAQGAKAPGSRNVLLRFYPPQAGTDSRKKKVYEQQENEANPLRCPVRLYEFYLSKCPESVKTRNDVFYLQPERSCVPDSPVWYSTQALSQESLQKMLHRVKMVKEINVALLTA